MFFVINKCRLESVSFGELVLIMLINWCFFVGGLFFVVELLDGWESWVVWMLCLMLIVWGLFDN